MSDPRVAIHPMINESIVCESVDALVSGWGRAMSGGVSGVPETSIVPAAVGTSKPDQVQDIYQSARIGRSVFGRAGGIHMGKWGG